MCRKLSTLVFACVLGFAPVVSADLVGWWTFDEGSGTVVHDSSGNAIDGTFQGNPQWVEGMSGGALEFGGSDWVDFGNPAKLNINGPITIACWINPEVVSAVRSFVGYNGGYAFKANNTNLQFTTPGILDHFGTKAPLKIGAWMHVAVTFKPGTPSNGLIFYVNGAESDRLTSSAMNVGTGPFLIGNNQWSEIFMGVIDDVRVYNSILTPAEVKKLAFRPKAYAPSPADGATGVMQPLMQWTPGSSAQWHLIYLGTTPELGQADFKMKQPLMQTMYYHFPGLLPALQPGTTYYWRIDEMEADNKTTYQGDVWSFTMAPLTAYAPNPRNGDKWIDPNADLSWLPGQNASNHELYFGTDKDAVAARDAGVFKGKLNVASFEPGTLAPQTTYYWVVDEISMGTTAGEVWSFTTAGGGGGVKGEYFNNMLVSGTPALTRIDPEIDFSWGDPGGPGTPIGNDNFSARWTADLEVAVADTYTFITTSDDGVRLWLGDTMIVDSWVDQGATDHASRAQKLDPGIYPLRMEYYENIGGAVAQLSWETPSMARQIIPAGPLQPPVRARAIYPKNDDVNVPQDVTLMWSVGEKAATHDVYFGEDEAAVAAATPADAGVYQGSQTLDENTFVPGPLEWNKTYYWRVDEVNTVDADSPWKGSVWRFTTADFIVVDDFETYVDETIGRIFQTWIDGWGYTEPAPGNPGNGTGATVGYIDPPFAERTIVHSGAQSMPFDYNNIVPPYYSETERTFDSPQNWKVNGVTDLSLQVRGYPVSFVETSPGNITMSASGADIVNATDEFRYAYKRLSGDGSLTVRVESLMNTAAWAKAGVIIRLGLEPASQQVHMIVTPSNLVEFMYRSGSGLNTTQFATAAGSTPLPHWVRLTRKGNTFTGEYSPDGTSWTKITTTDGTTSVIDVVMQGDVYIGLALTATNRNAINTAVFSNVQVTGATGSWQVAEIGYDHPGNDPASLYVAIADNSGKLAVVTNPDINAVLTTDWTEWKIPLSQFTGVNLGAVKKIYMGVGDRNAPQADGTGKLFIDDIRVVKPATQP